MYPADFWRALLLRQPNNTQFQSTLTEAIIIEEVTNKSAEQIYADHFAPEAADEQLRGKLSLEKVQEICLRYRSILFSPTLTITPAPPSLLIPPLN